jgi:hypothetical protein
VTTAKPQDCDDSNESGYDSDGNGETSEGEEGDGGGYTVARASPAGRWAAIVIALAWLLTRARRRPRY